MKSDLDKLKDMFIGMDVNGKLESVLVKSDFDKIYKRHEVMSESMTDSRLNALELKALHSDNISELKSIVSQLIASHRLLYTEIKYEEAKIDIFKQKMESILKGM